MTVKVRDLELSSAAGAATALERASAASLRFCRQAAEDEGRVEVTILVCRRDMVARFVRKLSARKVTLLHAWSNSTVQFASGPQYDRASGG